MGQWIILHILFYKEDTKDLNKIHKTNIIQLMEGEDDKSDSITDNNIIEGKISELDNLINSYKKTKYKKILINNF